MTYRIITVEGRNFKYSVSRDAVWVQDIGSVFIGVVGHCVDTSMDRYEVTPRHVEEFIRRKLNLPRVVESVPKPKKVDPGPRTRGFAKLIGTEIGSVEVNEQGKIVLRGTDGSSYLIDTYVDRRIPGEPTVTQCTQTGLPDPDFN